MRTAIAALCALVLLVAHVGTAQAIIYKSPGPNYKQGQVGAGVIYDSTKRKVTSDALPAGTSSVDLKYTAFMGSFGFGLGEAGVLEVHAGQISGKIEQEDTASGTIFGAGLRYTVADTGKVRHGFLAAFHSGSVSNDTSSTDVSQTDLGYGAAFAFGDKGAMYAGGVFSSLNGTLSLEVPPYYSYDFEGDASVGFFGGVEFAASPTLVIGAEIHALHDSSFGFYVDGKF